ncbi:hypothetical protein [Paludibacterium denitrificans]|uniref:Uncharacterized protein n=1 Tax=Paludibacterium denitrificans TaxID=2675226 RepID=A0A844GEM2_9NEIS|nr:hypothetical protein [Paludibacterium denitrificans]MTD33770.1 hypothetical protein [Paludibacterium denitrificans]
MDYQAFLRQLETHTLPVADFNHQAHLYAARAYRRLYPAGEAAVRCSRAFSRYVMAQGSIRKYHHSLTMALLAILYSLLDACPELTEDWDAFCQNCTDVIEDARAVVLEHYSADRLDEEAARKAFVAPDKKPLPTACLLH